MKTNPVFGQVQMPLLLRTPAFAAAWAEWVRHLREKRCHTTPTAFARQMKFCDRLGPRLAVLSIEQSINSNWQGLFEPHGAGLGGKEPGAARKCFSQEWKEQNP